MRSRRLCPFYDLSGQQEERMSGKGIQQDCEQCGKSIVKSNMKKHLRRCKSVPYVKKTRKEINHDAYERHRAARLKYKRMKMAKNVFERLKGKNGY